MKIAFENFFSPLPVPSVVKKDTMPTDAPKGTWPSSVDSDSDWTKLRAARGARWLGTTLSHPWECALSNPSVVQLWLELASRHTLWFNICGDVSPFPCHFAVTFSFFKGDMCSSLVPQVGISTCLGLFTLHPLGRGGHQGRAYAQQFCMENGPSPQGLVKHQLLVTPGAGGSCKAEARSYLLSPHPAEFRSCAFSMVAEAERRGAGLYV